MSMFNRAVKLQFNHMKYANLKSKSKSNSIFKKYKGI